MPYNFCTVSGAGRKNQLCWDEAFFAGFKLVGACQKKWGFNLYLFAVQRDVLPESLFSGLITGEVGGSAPECFDVTRSRFGEVELEALHEGADLGVDRGPALAKGDHIGKGLRSHSSEDRDPKLVLRTELFYVADPCDWRHPSGMDERFICRTATARSPSHGSVYAHRVVREIGFVVRWTFRNA